MQPRGSTRRPRPPHGALRVLAIVAAISACTGEGAGAAFYSQNLRPEACHGVFTPRTTRCFTVEVVNAGDASGQATCHMTASKNVRTQPARFGEDVRTPVLAPGQSAVVELRVALRPELKITLVRCLPGMLMSS